MIGCTGVGSSDASESESTDRHAELDEVS